MDATEKMHWVLRRAGIYGLLHDCGQTDYAVGEWRLRPIQSKQSFDLGETEKADGFCASFGRGGERDIMVILSRWGADSASKSMIPGCGR